MLVQEKRKLFTSFVALNMTQFFSALNDNIFKLLLIFFLIGLKGTEHSSTILSLAGAIFVIPFLLFASVAGTLADRFSKGSIIISTRLLEILIVSLGVLSFGLKSPVGGYAILFLMATQSTLFSPAKYGILPEIVPKERISRYNGIMTATTYLAIIFGTFLASFLADLTHQNYLLSSSFCILIAILGALTSLKIEKTKPQSIHQKVSARFITQIYKTLKNAKEIHYLLPALFLGSFFLFLGAYVQLNIIPFTIESLHESEVQGGYLFLMTAIGIGIGSFLAGRISGREIELGFVPFAAFGITLVLVLLYVFEHHFFVVVPLLILLGILGGFYIVPIESFIQVASPSKNRGKNVAAANFLSFLGVIFASGLIALFGNALSLRAAHGFLIVGLMTLIISFLLLVTMADQVLRLIVAKTARLFWNLHISGTQYVKETPPQLLIAKRRSWIDTIIMMAALPRRIPYIVPIRGRFLKSRSLLYRLLRIIPLDIDQFSLMGEKTLERLRKEVAAGHTVCLMHPVSNKQEWEQTMKELIAEIPLPIVSVHIQRKFLLQKKILAQVIALFKEPIKVSYRPLKE